MNTITSQRSPLRYHSPTGSGVYGAHHQEYTQLFEQLLNKAMDQQTIAQSRFPGVPLEVNKTTKSFRELCHAVININNKIGYLLDCYDRQVQTQMKTQSEEHRTTLRKLELDLKSYATREKKLTEDISRFKCDEVPTSLKDSKNYTDNAQDLLKVMN